MSRKQVSVILNDAMFHTDTNYRSRDVQQALQCLVECMMDISDLVGSRGVRFWRIRDYQHNMIRVDGQPMTLAAAIDQLLGDKKSNQDAYNYLVEMLTRTAHVDSYDSDNSAVPNDIYDADVCAYRVREEDRTRGTQATAYGRAVDNDQAAVTAPLRGMPCGSTVEVKRVSDADYTQVRNVAQKGHVNLHRVYWGVRKYEPYEKHTNATPWPGASPMINDDAKAEKMLNLAINIWRRTSDKLIYLDADADTYYEFQPTDKANLVYHGYRPDDVTKQERKAYSKKIKKEQP